MWLGRSTLAVLGELEAEVMAILWREAPLAVKDVSRRLTGARPLAYTTVMTTLDRLFKKGLLARTKVGHAFAYSPAMTREDFERKAVATLLGPLFQRSKEAVLSGVLDLAAAADASDLDMLERMIEAKRRERP